MDKSARHADSHIGRHLKLRDLHILSVVVQWGSMSKAALHLSMSQPAVSESIANLESELGVRLLDRSKRGVEPTLYAHALLKRSNVAFDELRQGIKDIAFLADPTEGEVVVACGDTIASGLLPTTIVRLSRRHPKIIVRVVQSNAEALEFRELRERKVDLALTRIAGRCTEGDLDAEVLFEDPHRVVASARSRWARRRKIDLRELANEPWVFASNRVIRELIAEAFGACGLKMPREKVSANSILLRNHLLATGRFLTVLPDSVVRYNAMHWSLKALPIDLNVQPRSVVMLTLKHRTISPVVQVLIDGLRAVATDISARQTSGSRTAVRTLSHVRPN